MRRPERRTIPRFEVWVPAKIEVEGERFDCRIYDISRRAGFVTCDRVWPVETELALAIVLPGAKESLVLQGRVVRVGETAKTRGMGILFTDVRAAAAAFIELILDFQERGRGGGGGSEPEGRGARG
jgi:hypothetical protein